MSTYKKTNALIDGKVVFKPDCIGTYTAFELQEHLPALQQMYKDAFLYGHRAWIDDYNALCFKTRQTIQGLYDFLIGIIPRLSAYNWFGKEPVLLSKEEYSDIYNFFEQSGEISTYIACIEEMMFTSILFKYKHTERPTNIQELDNIHYAFTTIREFLNSYVPESDRADKIKSEAA